MTHQQPFGDYRPNTTTVSVEANAKKTELSVEQRIANARQTAFQEGFEAGYDKGFASGRRSVAPVPHPASPFPGTPINPGIPGVFPTVTWRDGHVTSSTGRPSDTL